MAYLINNYDGSPLVNVQDRTINITTTSLKLPGRDYRPYGETMVENLIYLLQNFAQGVPPQNPINGQIWFDTSFKQVKVYDGTTLSWIPVGSPQSGTSLPAQGGSGQVFYHTVKRQLFVWDATSSTWRLVGPVGSYDNSETQSALPPHSAWEVVQILDTSATPVLRTVWRLTIAGSLVLIVASATFNAGIPGFTDPIQPGINLRTTFNLVGTASRALVSDNTSALDGLPASRFMRLDANNEPDQTNVRSLGSSTNRYASVHAAQFVGEATTALLANVANTATVATTANLLNGEPSSYYTNATNLATGTVAEARLPNNVMLKSGAVMTGPLTLNGPPVTSLQAATKQYVDNKVIRSSPYTVLGTSVLMAAPVGFVANRLTVIFDSISITNNSDFLIQLGTVSGLDTTGYVGGGTRAGSSDFAATASYTTGFGFGAGDVNSTDQYSGRLVLELANSSTNLWVAQGSVTGRQAFSYSFICGGRKTLAGPITQLALVILGSGSFDNGNVTLVWE